jgi:protocatechuate 3,4-dioxygenase beta subunit
MKKHLSLLFILLAAFGGLAVYALQGDEDSWDPSIVDKMSADDAKSEGAAKSLTGDAAAREVVEASNKEVKLSIQGRVVDKAGAPVANAEVSLAARADFRSLFSNPERGDRGERRERGGRGENPTERTDRGGRRRGGNRTGDGEDQGGRTGRGGRTRGGRGGSGRDRGAAAEGGESSRDRRSRGASFREALRPQKMAGSVRTDSDGGFALTGYAPTGGSLEIQVDHPSFVHKSARARIEKDKTDVKVKDIVLQRAANVAGIVVDETGRAIANATVQLRSSRRSRSRDGNESSSIADLAERFRRGGRGGNRGGEQGGSQGGGQSGQGGESGRGGRRSRGNRGGGGFDRSNLESMLEGFGGGRGRTERIAAVATDEDGKFAIFRVPAGGFTADAKADKHLPGKSDRFDLIEGDNRNDVRIQLGIGVELVGVVLNKSGEPIVGAAVEAAWTPQEKVNEAAKTGEASPAANANSNPDEGGRRSRRGRGGSRGGFGGFGGRGGLTGGFGGFGNRGAASRIEELTKTDKDGKFVLDSLPRGEFKLEIKHKDYVEWEDRKFSVAKTPSVEVRMDGRLFLVGVVVDKSTGEPVENYGIVARSVRGPHRGHEPHP